MTESSFTAKDIMESIRYTQKRLNEINNAWFNKLAEENGIDNPDEYMLLMDYPTAKKYGVSDHPKVNTSQFVTTPMFVRKDLFIINRSVPGCRNSM
jgi:hypothetical protein